MHRLGAVLIAFVLSFGCVRLAQAESLAALAEAARAAMAETPPAAPARAPAPQPMAAVELSVPVPNVTIHVGEIITDAMLQDRSYSSALIERYSVATNRASLIGRVAKRVLVAGNPIPANAVGSAKVITRGVAATIVFEEGGLSIRAVGMPLESGTTGAVIRLKNLDSGQVITGIVQSDGSVKVGG
ncbi:flagellar basal body P-ring formation chaperone FlgA [Aquabacter sp. CN5-332]|uniref:flagellar basal body P-ring formation chaperone FlgA n=1 Tax=Aquabacter sp. CN5-332 TaxID=3156608 RepID=UPI0032B3AF07